MSNHTQGQEVFNQVLGQINGTLSYASVSNLDAESTVDDVLKGCVIGALALMKDKSPTMELDLLQAGSVSRNQELKDLVDKALNSF